MVESLQVAVALILLVAAGGKLVAPGDLSAAVKASGTVPKAAASPVAAAVVCIELLLGFGTLALSGRALSVAFAGVALLGAVFSGWSLSVLLRGITLRCGCFGGTSKDVTWMTAARAFALFLLGAAGAVLAVKGSSLFEPSALSAITATGLCLGVLLITAFVRTRATLVLTSTSVASLRSLANEVRT